MTPRQIGPFRILQRLGQGGAGEVFLAVWHGASGFEKRVALKVLREEHRGDPDYEHRLVDEARLAARFSHPHLVSVSDLGVSQGVYWVRMEFVDGIDLAQALARGPLPTALALAVALDVAEALRYLHALADEAGRPLRLVHRDVAPSNILLGRDGFVRLSDFGIARATAHREDTEAGVRRGTWSYMSPEQVRAQALTAASDQFALGAVLYHALTGHRPFDADTPLATMDHIREATLPPRRGLDAGVWALLSQMFARRPEDRFESSTELVKALAGVLAAHSPYPREALAYLVASRA
ncbi:MAG: serine/threonine protein kinase [Myxococcales bacterium]|nr:serine/threonine protein kinase [Myxococcales bacterium]